MSVHDEPKIDCHHHLFDPARFPYAPQAWYRPAEHEQSSADQLLQLFDAHGVEYGLMVGPNSGYDTDNRCLLDAVRRSRGRLKGVAVVDNATDRASLASLRDQVIVGTTMQAALLGVDHFRDIGPLLADVAELGMFADVQVEGDQLVELAPVLEPSGVQVLVDHCGRPVPAAGLNQPGFRLLLELAATGRYVVKLSGMYKFSAVRYPYEDTWPYVRALVDAFTPERCVWGSDWPFVRAPERLDYGPMLTLLERLVPDSDERRAVLWDTPRRLFGLGATDA